MLMENQEPSSRKLPVGIRLLVAFFVFGAVACTITVTALLFAGGVFDQVWWLNPDAHAEFLRIGRFWSVLLMITVGTACGGAAFGLARSAEWGRRLAIAILSVNLIGDSINALVRQDSRTLIGLPIGGAMIFYLLRSAKPAPQVTTPAEEGR